MATLPIHDFRKGLIRVRIWRNRTASGIRHSVSVVRLVQKWLWKELPRFERDVAPAWSIAANFCQFLLNRRGPTVTAPAEPVFSSPIGRSGTFPR